METTRMFDDVKNSALSPSFSWRAAAGSASAGGEVFCVRQISLATQQLAVYGPKISWLMWRMGQHKSRTRMVVKKELAAAGWKVYKNGPA
jgi:hypothetical protein